MELHKKKLTYNKCLIKVTHLDFIKI